MIAGEHQCPAFLFSKSIQPASAFPLVDGEPCPDGVRGDRSLPGEKLIDKDRPQDLGQRAHLIYRCLLVLRGDGTGAAFVGASSRHTKS